MIEAEPFKKYANTISDTMRNHLLKVLDMELEMLKEQSGLKDIMILGKDSIGLSFNVDELYREYEKEKNTR